MKRSLFDSQEVLHCVGRISESHRRAGNLELGYGVDFPKSLLRKMEFDVNCEARKPPRLKVTRGMLVLGVYGNEAGKLDLGDWVFALNSKIITNKKHYYKIIKEQLRLNIPYTLKYTVYRTLRTKVIENATSSPLIPQALEVQSGFEYLIGYITMCPGSSLGVNIKAYNYKVFVTGTDNGFQSLGMRTFLVGDAILAVDGEPQTTIAGTSSQIIQALTKRKYVSVVIERAQSAAAIGRVRQALLAEKTRDKDPRMPDDTIQICRDEVKRIQSAPDPLLTSIYIDHSNTFDFLLKKMIKGSNTVKVALNSVESTIGMNPINPVLLQHVPPPPTIQQQQRQQQEQRPSSGIPLSRQSNSSTSSNRKSARKRFGSKRR
uniref:PDZ domain-containing protein n=1 Tax=Ascaris lumbricoides TaxID=6252 RepID=A0A0M3I1F3_ASCLU